MGKMIGSTFSVPYVMESMELIKTSKEEAKNYEWLYHCTSVDALLSIIENREMWLSNLQDVNDKEEVGRIDCKEYEKSYYVACFTYESAITEEHWREYGQSDQKVLFGVKSSWFKKKLDFLNVDHTKTEWECFKILNSFDKAVEYQMKSAKEGKSVVPFYVMDYGFYKIIYDDKLKKRIKSKAIWNIDGVGLEGAAFTTEIPGIIKSTHGICVRDGKEPYDKDWTLEKEISVAPLSA